MLKEELKDTGEILETILTQPLLVPGLHEEISLLDAAKNYQPNALDRSDLSKILRSFLENPEPTQVLITELEILRDDITL